MKEVMNKKEVKQTTTNEEFKDVAKEEAAEEEVNIDKILLNDVEYIYLQTLKSFLNSKKELKIAKKNLSLNTYTPTANVEYLYLQALKTFFNSKEELKIAKNNLKNNLNFKF